MASFGVDDAVTSRAALCLVAVRNADLRPLYEAAADRGVAGATPANRYPSNQSGNRRINALGPSSDNPVRRASRNETSPRHQAASDPSLPRTTSSGKPRL